MCSAQRIPTTVNLGFLDRSSYFSIQVAPQLSSRGWVGPVPDPLLLRKFGSAGNRTRDLWICSQELWPLDHRGCHTYYIEAGFAPSLPSTTTVEAQSVSAQDDDPWSLLDSPRRQINMNGLLYSPPAVIENLMYVWDGLISIFLA
jgi:hypothetical protein